MRLEKRTRLKRKYLVIFTVLITLISIATIEFAQQRIEQIKKIADKCDNLTGYTCDYYTIKSFNK